MALVLFAWLVVAQPGAVDAPEAPFSVGIATRDISPDFSVRLSGYGGRRAESEGIEQRLFAKALVIDDGTGPALLLTVESCAVTEAFTESVHRVLGERFGIPRERFVLSASHTHSAPMLTGALPTLFGEPIPAEHQKNIDRYTSALRQHLIDVTEAALARRRPARLEWSHGYLGFAANRRTAGGPVDRDLPVLRARALDGALLAVLANYACHCTTLGGGFNRIHGDWSGAAQHEIEARHPGTTALITIGCGGDANPQPRGTLDHVRQHAEALADEVDRLIALDGEALIGPLQCHFDRLELPFDVPPTRAELEGLSQRSDAIGHHARVQLARLDRGEGLRTAMRYPVQSWRFGDSLAWVFLGGEVVVDYSLRLKEELDRQRLWVTAYSNDVPGYIPSERILSEGGYEGGGAMIYYDQPTRLRSGIEAQIVDTVRRQVGPSFLAAGADRTGDVSPLSPIQSWSAIETEPGLRVELVAAEPLVVDPVAIDFADDGALFVAEMHDYPEGVDGRYGIGGRVKRLVDRDGDGRFDAATVFLEALPFPTGVTVCENGVLVCAAPDILYAEDTDGDGRADVRRVVLTGFETSNYQARVNSIVRGLDGWWYAANGLLGGLIGPPGSEARVDIRGRDFRFRLDGTVEPVAGLTQQGRARDEFDRWFGCDNSTWIWHMPFTDTGRGGGGAWAAPPARVAIASGDAGARLYPIAPVAERFNEPASAGFVTSACGLEVYRSDRLGAGFRGDVFVCEPVHNIVRRFELSPKGSTFEAQRVPPHAAREFLASRDPWFRPVQVRTGPNGGLWVVDMYRWVIEHPRWIAPEALAALDLRAGSDRGRLYRIVPRDGLPPVTPRALTRSVDLVNALLEAQGARRDRLQELLVARADEHTEMLLRVLALESKDAGLRAVALATLAELDRVTTLDLYEGLRDDHRGVRRLALSLVGPRLADSPELRAFIRERLLEDPAFEVRLEIAASLASWPEVEAVDVMIGLLRGGGDDPWLRAAALSSASPQLEALLRRADELPASATEALFRLALVSDRSEALDLATRLAVTREPLEQQFESLQPLLRAFEAAAADGHPLRSRSPAVVDAWMPFAARLRVIARNQKEPVELREAAIRWLAVGLEDAENVEAWIATLHPRTEERLQLRALDALARRGDERVPAALLQRAGSAAPRVRGRMVATLLQRHEWIRAWMASESGRELLAAATPEQRQRLATNEDATIRERAKQWLSGSSTSNRSEVLASYRSAAQAGGDAERGAHEYDRVCARCHEADPAGRQVGPDLRAWTGFSPTALLEAVFDPNATVLDTYVGYLVELDDGRLLSGRIEDESAGSLTLITPELERLSIRRDQIEALSRTGLSTMPDGLESELLPEQFRDLVAWFESREPAPKSFPGNRPQAIVPETEQGFVLKASEAEIRGGDICFEVPFQNIGYWHGETDRVLWKLELPRSGDFRVELEYACPDDCAGQAFRLETAEGELNATVASTGSWSEYRRVTLGTIHLNAGRQRILVRPAGPLRAPLMDLRALHWKPADQ